MADLLVVVGVVAFFAATVAYLRACESLVERSSLPTDAGDDTPTRGGAPDSLPDSALASTPVAESAP